jgi:hypothetical protein
MNDNEEIILQLQEKLESLSRKQVSLQNEIRILSNEIAQLRPAPAPQPAEDVPVEKPPPVEKEVQQIIPAVSKSLKFKSGFEKFVGENLINKIGIAITVIGVGIGAKYAIDHNLISPWTRIILGYLSGLCLLGFALHLKKQYLTFSAVLYSGSMAILYFITYAAITFYSLMPLPLAFALMTIFTVLTVLAAITYNQQVIAHIGLVGAYAVPFLLSHEPGNITVLFSYITLINAGILIIAFKKYWKPLYYSSSILTWLIMIVWYFQSYQASVHFQISISFASVFFIIFYTMFIAYKIMKHGTFNLEDILLLLGNSFIFFGMGYSILVKNETSEVMLGLYTAANSLIHLIVSYVIYLQKKADRNLLYFIAGLSLVFFTMAIPIGLNGNWVTMLWSAETALLFWIGRTKKTVVYELLSYPLMFLAFFSLTDDWVSHYHFSRAIEVADKIMPIFNILFLTSLFFIASFTFINILNLRKRYESPLHEKPWLLTMMNFFMPALLVVVLYGLFVMEISTFWNQKYYDTIVTINSDLTVPEHLKNADLIRYNSLSIIDYSLLFLSLISFVNIKRIKNGLFSSINLAFNAIALGIFLTIGLYAIGELRSSYLQQEHAEYFYRGFWNIGIRYISFGFVGLMLYSINQYISQKRVEADLKNEFDLLLHITLLTMLSNELINWMDLLKPEYSYKLGLSILFGMYSLILIVLGIWKKKKHLRFGAMALFAGTLAKLFFYDIGYLDTISKTIVFISLGVLLLIISFLYNKYRKLIF